MRRTYSYPKLVVLLTLSLVRARDVFDASSHKRSKRADPNYVLPLTLQPTVLQQTVPHDERIDGVILPSLRDALIREVPHLELTDVFQDLLDGLTVHSAEAPLDPINWEVHESFMRQYP